MQNKNIQTQVRKNMVTYITAAFGLVAGLAWNDAIKALIEYLFPLDTGSVSAKFVYALIVTVLLVVATFYLSRLFKDKENV